MFERLCFDVLTITCYTRILSIGTNTKEVSISTRVNKILWRHQMWCIWTALFLSSSVTWRKFGVSFGAQCYITKITCVILFIRLSLLHTQVW